MDEWLGGPTPGAPPRPTTLSELAAVAAEQRGLVTRQQCLQAGMSSKAIEVRLASRWVRVHRGVFQTMPGRDDFWTTAMAAHLACAPNAAWSHGTAAYRWGLIAAAPRSVEILVPTHFAIRPPAGTVVRRLRDLDDRVDPLRWPWLTTLEETILDLAETGSVDEMFASLGRAFQRGLTSEEAVLRRLGTRGKHRRRALLTLSLSDAADGSESAMEIRFVRDVERAHGLPVGERQVATEPGRPQRHDVGGGAQRVLVELDGRLGHESRGERVADGTRDRRSATNGWLTVRALWRDVAVDPCSLAGDVGAVLTNRGWTGQVRSCRRHPCTALRGTARDH